MPDDVALLDPLSKRLQPVAEFLAQWAPRPNGKPYTDSGARSLIRRNRIPIVRIGLNNYIDLVRYGEELTANPPPLRRRSPSPPKQQRRVRLKD